MHCSYWVRRACEIPCLVRRYIRANQLVSRWYRVREKKLLIRDKKNSTTTVLNGISPWLGLHDIESVPVCFTNPSYCGFLLRRIIVITHPPLKTVRLIDCLTFIIKYLWFVAIIESTIIRTCLLATISKESNVCRCIVEKTMLTNQSTDSNTLSVETRFVSSWRWSDSGRYIVPWPTIGSSASRVLKRVPVFRDQRSSSRVRRVWSGGCFKWPEPSCRPKGFLRFVAQVVAISLVVS